MSRVMKLAVLAGTIGPLLFAGVLIALTFAEYHFMRSLGWEPLSLTAVDWPSGLALGPYGRVMTAAFLINSVSVGLFALGLRRTLPTTAAARTAIWLLLLAAIAMMGLVATTDPSNHSTPVTWHGRVHDLSFAILGCTLFPSMLILGWVFRRDSRWRGLSTYTWLTAGLAIPTFAIKGVAFYLFLGGVVTWTVIVTRRMSKLSRPTTPGILF
jgi:Protein of unknown function (DUF998)